jgi:hypothetical protein
MHLVGFILRNVCQFIIYLAACFLSIISRRILICLCNSAVSFVSTPDSYFIFNKTTNQMQINLIFIVLSRRHRSTCFGHCCAHHQKPPPTAFAASGYRVIARLDLLQAVVGLQVNRPELEARPIPAIIR